MLIFECSEAVESKLVQLEAICTVILLPPMVNVLLLLCLIANLSHPLSIHFSLFLSLLPSDHILITCKYFGRVAQITEESPFSVFSRIDSTVKDCSGQS